MRFSKFGADSSSKVVKSGAGSESASSFKGRSRSFSIKRPSISFHSGIVSTSPKALFIIIVYMFLLSTTCMAFQVGYAEFNPNYAISGEISDSGAGGIGMPDNHFDHSIYEVDYDNLPDVIISRFGSRDFDVVTEYSDGSSIKWIIDTEKWIYYGWQYIGGAFSLSVYRVTQWIFEEYFNVEIRPDAVVTSEEHWWSLAGEVVGNIRSGLSYIYNFLTFNFVPNIEMPFLLRWIPFMMALPVWIYVGLLLLPISIEILKATANVLAAIIPF